MSKGKNPEKENKEPKKKKSLLWRIVKWTLLILVLIYVLLIVLSKLGGSTPILKQAVEDYISQNTGRSAKIGKLNNMSFFPDVGLDFVGLTIEDLSGNTLPITVSETKVAFRFFDVLLGRKNIRTLDIKDINIPAGVLADYNLELDRLYIEDVEEGAFLKAFGQVNEKPGAATLPMQVHGSRYGRYYSMLDENKLEATLGDLKVITTLDDKKLKNLELYLKDTKVLSGDFEIDRGVGEFDIEGDATILPGGSKLKPDLELDFSDKLVLKGKIGSEFLQIDDFHGQSPFMKTLDEISTIFGSKEGKGLDFNDQTADVKIDVKSLKSKSIDLGELDTTLKIQDNILTLEPVNGKISKGALSGSLSLNATAQPAAMKIDLKINDFDYGEFQQQFQKEADIDGRAEIGIALTASGKTSKALQSSLRGTLSFVGGEGKMRSNVLNIWGGGLLNALLPNFGEDTSLEMNCIVANFKLDNAIAEADALFVDTKSVTLTGSGNYNIDKDDVDMKLTPKAKDVALGDISSVVNISGPLSDMSATPNMFDLGKKVGGLLLGAVNPAFLAVTLTDLGLRDSHPCKAFIIEKEDLAAPPEPKAEEASEVSPEAEPTETKETNE